MAGSVYEGKSFEEAVRKGLEALRLTRAEAVITTIEEGKGGFLGIGARPFRVSVARRPGGAIREPGERTREAKNAGDERRGGRRGGREARSGGPSAAGSGGARTRGGSEGQGRSERGRGRDRGPRERGPAEETGGAPARASGAGATEAGGGSGRQGRAGRGERGERGGRGAGREARGTSERGSAPQGASERERPREREAPRPHAEAAERGAPRGGAPERAERPPLKTPPVTGGAMAPSSAEPEGSEALRKRRRRGRRGGRGRRRGGAGEEGAPGVNGTERAGAPGVEGETLQATSPATGSWEDDADDLELDERVDVAAPHADDFPATARGDEDRGAASAAPDSGFAAHEYPAAERAGYREPQHVPEPAMARATMEAGSVGMRHAERRERHERSETPEMTSEELSATSKSLTEELLGAMGFESRVSVRAEGNRVDVTVEVDRDDDLLNGRQGETRQALQHLLNRFLNKGDGSRYHLQLEVNDFWQRREAELAELARRLAEEAVTNNAEVVSDYMNSQERRIVHMTLKEDGRVKTFSLGSGMVKRVAVAPAGFPERTEDDTES